MTHETDELKTNPSLLLRLRDVRNKQAWDVFVEVYGPLILSYCRRRNLQNSDALDVSQDVLTSLSKALRNFEYQPEKGRFRDWLGVVTNRELQRFWKRGTRRPGTHWDGEHMFERVEENGDWNEHFQTQLLETAMRRIQSEFEADTWKIFEQLWIDNKSPSEVASAFNISAGNAYVAKSRVLKRLRSEVLMLSDDLPLLDH